MHIWTVAVFLVASLCAVNAQFICTVETTGSYFVEVSTGCRVYHFCNDGGLKTMVCPVGEAFDTLTSTCKSAESVACFEVLPELGSGYEFPEPDTSLIVQDHHARTKRGLFDYVYSFGSSFIKSTVRRKTEAIFGTDSAINNRILLPIVYEMLDDSTSRGELFQVLSMAESALDPIKADILRQGRAYPGANMQINTARIEAAIKELYYKVRPYLTNLAIRHISKIRAQVVGHLQLIKQSINKLIIANYASARELMSAIVRFANKHMGLARTSTSQYLRTHSMYEIFNDFVPVGQAFMKVGAEHLRKFPNSIVHLLEGGQLPNRPPPSYPGRRFNSRFFEFE